EDELVTGNALVQLGTFVAILAGTILGGFFVSLGREGLATVATGGVILAVGGWHASQRIPLAPAPAPDLLPRWNPIVEPRESLACARENRTVFLSLLGGAWFWFYGALFLAQFPGLGREVLGGDERLVTLLLVVFSVGVGAGCILCERLS